VIQVQYEAGCLFHKLRIVEFHIPVKTSEFKIKLICFSSANDNGNEILISKNIIKDTRE